MNRLFACVLVPALGFVGCMDADDSPDSLGATEQNVSSTLLAFNSCANGSCDVAIDTAFGNVCFLAGVVGDLTDASGSVPAGAWVDNINNGQNTNQWWIHLRSPNANNIGAMTACIPAATYTHASWYAGNAGMVVHGSATTRCFMSGVENFNYRYAYSGFDSNAFIDRKPVGRGVDQILNGFFPVGSNIRLDMNCTDIPTSWGDWNYGNGTASGVTFNLAANDPPYGGVVCGLTGLGGQFATKSSNDGVLIQYSSGTSTWGIEISAWKGMHAECVR
jgi:hypothetical protein